MTYLSWFNEHGQKQKHIVDKLLSSGKSLNEIIDYFDFESMCENEPDFCPLYAEGKKCHDLESLNCFLCSCPNFRFKDEGIDIINGKTRHSYCSIDSKDGAVGVYGDKIHQDCSGCSVPHHKEYVKKHFHTNWFDIMKDSPLKS
jgi:hypothetical protein